MLSCQNCGAQVEPNSPKCEFCGALTAGGIWQQHDEQRREREQEQAAQAQAHHQAAQEHHHRLRQEQALKSSASSALIWSIVGAVLCCIPIPAVVALVMSLRVRAEAKRMSVPWPTNGIAALGISVLSILAFVGLIVNSVLEDQARDERIGALESKANKGSKKKKLKLDTACALVEIELLQTTFEGQAGSNLDTVKCPGDLKVKGKSAKLDDIHAQYNQKKVRLVACFKRGSKWSVDELGTEECGDTKPGAAKPSGGSSAKPSDSANEP